LNFIQSDKSKIVVIFTRNYPSINLTIYFELMKYMLLYHSILYKR